MPLNKAFNVQPYGLNFYVKGVKTASKTNNNDSQDNGVAPADQTTAYFPAQGVINWSYTHHMSGDECNVAAHTNALASGNGYSVYGPTTLFMKATAQGAFSNKTYNMEWAEQQAKALPVRCIRDEIVGGDVNFGGETEDM